MHLKLAYILAFYFAIIPGQTKYCCYPVTWESVNFERDGLVGPGSKTAVINEITEKLSVDGVNQRIASFSIVNTGGYQIKVQILQLYNKNIMYIAEGGTCKTYKLPPWNPICVPDSATLAKKTYYGFKDKVDVDIYAVVSGPKTSYLTMTRADCVPVYQASYGQSQAGSELSFKTFSDITLGIKDQSVFDIPSSCTNITSIPTIMAKKHGLYWSIG
ncbi:mammalian ependymin-related protein 1-like isoform X2 [Ruditapes philippinarum]|nr:mammalian ependymin-related protein 1-like isoform X2 [Ruditapes philippinarum]